MHCAAVQCYAIPITQVRGAGRHRPQRVRSLQRSSSATDRRAALARFAAGLLLPLLLLPAPTAVAAAAMTAVQPPHTATTVAVQPHRMSRREYCQQNWRAAAAAGTSWVRTVVGVPTPVSAATAEPQPEPQPQQLELWCAQGALTEEQAIPGAYQQPCMALPVRSIPVRKNNVVGAVPQQQYQHQHALEIQQRTAATNPQQSLQQQQLAGSTGTVVWNSSLLLVRLLERLTTTTLDDNNNSMLRLGDQTVLELGCGTGLVSLAASCLGARRVIATDGNPAVVRLAASNIAQNHPSTSATNAIEAATLPWGWLAATAYSETADLVLGSDLTYFSGNWPALAETMATVLKPDTGMALYLSLGHSGFNVQAELDGFLSVAAGSGLVPAKSSGWSEQSLTHLLWEDCLTPSERTMIQNSGGVRVVALCLRSNILYR